VDRAVGLQKPDAFALPDTGGLATYFPDTDPTRPDDHSAKPTVRVEIVRGKLPVELDEAWRDLLRRTDEPNVFMHPCALRAAPAGRRIVTLLAWQLSGNTRRLSGLWAFAIGKPHLSVLPVTALCGPPTSNAYLAAPVVDRDALDVTLNAMLDAIAAATDLPKLIALESTGGAGAVHDALLRVLAQRESELHRLDTKSRPLLMPGDGAANYLEKAMSSSSRKKLRQQRRRLGEQGQLKTTIARALSDVQRAFEAFLILEAKGWKGRRGTALLRDPAEAAFARKMILALAQAGEASIYALELDGRPVSMQVVLQSGSAAYTWKTAYDETLGDFSPGVLLFEDYSKAFLADPSIVSADSCAFDDTGHMAAWTERKLVVDLWFDARPGASINLAVAAGMRKAYLPLRLAAKQIYLLSPIIQDWRRKAMALWMRKRKHGDQASSKSKDLAGALR
jgi:hypothetical protein